jgi:hypothetical protein
MGFLRGTTTWGALPQKIAQLMCGEVADDTSTTLPTGDRWVRETARTVTDGVLNATTTLTSATANFTVADTGSSVYATGVPLGTVISSVTNATTVVLSAAATASASGVTVLVSTDCLRTPTAKDVNTGPCSNRTGYFCAMGGLSLGQNVVDTPATTLVKVTAPFTGDPGSTSGFHRWQVWAQVTTVNSTPGNYSTAQITYSYVDADNQANIRTATPITLNAAGQATLVTGLAIQVTDPSGTLQASFQFFRSFSTTYLYGIDFWPMLYRIPGGASPTFSVSPPGVAGTDYDIVNNLAVPCMNNTSERYEKFNGLGIKTATGLGSGNLYTVSHPMSLNKIRIFPSPTVGVLSLDVGGTLRHDPLNLPQNGRMVGGQRITSWCKMFQTPASVTAASPIQYWMSVTNDGIYLACNADPGTTGKLGTAFVGALLPAEPTYDVFPICYNATITDYTADTPGNSAVMATPFSYNSLKRRQDGSEAPRDWQTKWMRGEPHGGGGYNVSSVYMATGYGQNSGCMADSGANAPNVSPPYNTPYPYQLTALGAVSSQASSSQNYPTRQNKPTTDGKWWLYGFTYGESGWTSGFSATDENRVVRGTHNRFFYIPGDSWGSGDELTDTSTSTKYLLLMPDYMGPGMRMQVNTNQFYGGIAIPEL